MLRLFSLSRGALTRWGAAAAKWIGFRSGRFLTRSGIKRLSTFQSLLKEGPKRVIGRIFKSADNFASWMAKRNPRIYRKLMGLSARMGKWGPKIVKAAPRIILELVLIELAFRGIEFLTEDMSDEEVEEFLNDHIGLITEELVDTIESLSTEYTWSEAVREHEVNMSLSDKAVLYAFFDMMNGYNESYEMSEAMEELEPIAEEQITALQYAEAAVLMFSSLLHSRVDSEAVLQMAGAAALFSANSTGFGGINFQVAAEEDDIVDIIESVFDAASGISEDNKAIAYLGVDNRSWDGLAGGAGVFLASIGDPYHFVRVFVQSRERLK